MEGQWYGGNWQPVSVTQPPPRAPRMNAKGLKGAERKEALKLLGEHRAFKKAAKGRIKALNKQIRKAKAGARMNARRRRFHKDEMAAAKRIARHQRKINAPLIRAQKAHLANLKNQIRGHKQAIAKSKKAIMASRRRIKQLQNAHGAHGQRRAGVRAYHQAKKAASWMWILHQAKKALQRGTRARKPDGRNHGFTGVRGRSGLTGLAGR